MVAHFHPRTQVDIRTRLLNQLGFIQKPQPTSPPQVGALPVSQDRICLPRWRSSSYASSLDEECSPSPTRSSSLSPSATTRTTLGHSVTLLQTFRMPLNDRPPPNATSTSSRNEGTAVYKTDFRSPLSIFFHQTIASTAASLSDSDRSDTTTVTTKDSTKNSCSTHNHITGHVVDSSCRKLAFQETVECTIIPSRHQYSDRIKQSMWTNRWELREMTHRNSLEFDYENYDWTQVVMEEHMYLDSRTGALIHPCHVQNQNRKNNRHQNIYHDQSLVTRRDSFSAVPAVR
jgi:hypothetical protein